MEKQFLQKACELAKKNVVDGNGGPFGALIVRDGEVIGEGVNTVVKSKNPCNHAEMNAIADACSNVDHFALPGAVCYTSCEPCPMCYAALRWARIDQIRFANSREDAARIGFSDEEIYEEIENRKTIQHERQIDVEGANGAFDLWEQISKKSPEIQY